MLRIVHILDMTITEITSTTGLSGNAILTERTAGFVTPDWLTRRRLC